MDFLDGTALAAGGGIGLLAAVVAGLLATFTPSGYAAFALVLAAVARTGRGFRSRPWLAAFVAGLLLTHVVVGVGAAAAGDLLFTVAGAGRRWELVTGILLIALGVVWTGWLPFPLPHAHADLRGRHVLGVGGAFLLGVPFTFGLCPACSPALWIALGTSAAFGSAAYGAALLAAFGLGRSVPLVLAGLGGARLQAGARLHRWHRWFRRIAGLLLTLAGLYLATHHLFPA